MAEIINKKLRLIELALILSIAFIPSFFYSLFIHLKLTSPCLEQQCVNVRFFLNSIQNLSLLALLFYIIFRQGRTAQDIGFGFNWRDVPAGVMLYFAIIIAEKIFRFIATHGLYFAYPGIMDLRPQNLDLFFRTKITFFYILYGAVTCFWEELIFRAYLINEIKLFASSATAVLISTLTQASYHLYQGTFSMTVIALSFFIFSLYYIRWKRIMPVIIAHLLFDFIPLVKCIYPFVEFFYT